MSMSGDPNRGPGGIPKEILQVAAGPYSPPPPGPKLPIVENAADPIEAVKEWRRHGVKTQALFLGSVADKLDVYRRILQALPNHVHGPPRDVIFCSGSGPELLERLGVVVGTGTVYDRITRKNRRVTLVQARVWGEPGPCSLHVTEDCSMLFQTSAERYDVKRRFRQYQWIDCVGFYFDARTGGSVGAEHMLRAHEIALIVASWS